MEFSALCIRLVMKMLLLQVAGVHLNNAQESYAVIVPTKLQLFEYSSLSINCEGFNTTGWTVMRKMKEGVDRCVSTWATTPPSLCAIKPVYLTDSGEYWCETGAERSNAVYITVTAGDVILESPALPVMEGGAVTLRCRSKRTSSALVADFYKDDLPIGTSSAGETTIHSVSKSNEGLYKCSISEFGESPQSWLAIEVPVPGETRPSSGCSCHVDLLFRTASSIVLVALLVLLGLLHSGKLRFTQQALIPTNVQD